MSYKLHHKHEPPWVRRLATGACCDSCASGGPCASGELVVTGRELDLKSLALGGLLGLLAGAVIWQKLS